MAQRKINKTAIALAIIFIIALGGCAPGQHEPTSDITPLTSSVKDSSAEPAFAPYFDTVNLNIAQLIYKTALPQGESYDNNQYTQYIKNMLNINTQVAWVASNENDYMQKLNLCIASDNMPDAVVVNDKSQMLSAHKYGLLMDISEIYETYASDLMKQIIDTSGGRVMNAATIDGRMMSLPGMHVLADGIHVMWLRKDWLDALGLDVPKTPDEIGKVAKAFIENKMGGENTVGIASPASNSLLYCNFLEPANNLAGFDPVFSAMDIYPGYWLRQPDGSCEYGSLSPNMKNALSLLSEWYSDGIIDPQIGLRNDSLETANANICGIIFAPWWIGYDIQDSLNADKHANWQTYPVYSADGRINIHCSTPTTRFTLISSKCKNPEAVIKIANLLLRDEGTLDSSTPIGWYPLRNPMAPGDECEYTIKELYKVLNGETKPEDYTEPGPYKLLASDVKKIKDVKLPPYDNMDIKYWNLSNIGDWGRYYSLLVGGRCLMMDYNHVYSETYELTESMPALWPNLRKLEYETMTKIVMGQATIDEFDSFVRLWKSEGGDKITQEVSALTNGIKK